MAQVTTPIRALFVDWAGTILDHGSRAPARVFIEVFAAAGVTIDEAEARGPMGMAKHDHIAAILALPRVAGAWAARHGAPPGPADAAALYERFLPLQKRVLAEHCDPIPGAAATFAFCRDHGIAVGSTTGYTRDLMSVVVPAAAAAGIAPDVVVCSDEVPAGRPAPWSNFRAAERLGVFPPAAILVVDDTAAGVAAGRNAGMRSLGVTLTGNGLGLSAEELATLDPADRARRGAAVARALGDAGADDCVTGIEAVPQWLQRHGLVG